MSPRYLLACVFIIFCGCTKDIELTEPVSRQEETVSPDAERGVVHIKLTESLADQIEITTDSSRVCTRVSTLDRVMSTLGASSMERLFPVDPRYEKRTRAEGLHLWYTVHFSDTIPLTRAVSNLSAIDGIEIVEEIVNSKPCVVFHDTYFSRQWQFYNDGSLPSSVAGADINLKPAWNKCTGNRDVLVAVIDYGVEYTHEDLADNMWINTAEANGIAGIDDDGNGYIDDVYGYDFFYKRGNISVGYHGTHIAGIISAVNNNNKGVCSIAGGNGSGNGVRIMSCVKYIDIGKDWKTVGPERCFKYAADNGAIVCQCSWCGVGVNTLSTSEVAAMRYFIKYAGCDADGNQVGPMKGGVVVFAAGNEHATISSSAMKEVIAVAAINRNWVAADFTNYGEWVDICAPGVATYSTYTNNSYNYMGGTSAACPHVSGTVALMISYFGKKGFTCDQLREKLLNSTSPEVYQYNPSYIGQLGTGMVDVAAALGIDTTATPPYTVSKMWGTIESANNIHVNWVGVGDPDEYDDVDTYRVYYSEEPITEITDTLPYVEYPGIHTDGDTLSALIKELSFNRTYYLAVKAIDRSGKSSVSEILTLKTDINHAPQLTLLNDDNVTIRSFQQYKYKILVTEPDNHAYTWKNQSLTGGVMLRKDCDTLIVTIDGLSSTPEIHTMTIGVTDAYGMETLLDIHYTVLPNHQPKLSKEVENVYIGSMDAVKTLNLCDYITDEDGEPLKFRAKNSNGVATAIVDSILTIIPVKSGLSAVTVTAIDACGTFIVTEITVMVRDDSQEIDLYPNPMAEILNIRVGEGIDETAELTFYNAIGVKCYSTSVSVSTFKPAVVNVSTLLGGSYTVHITYAGKTIRRNIVKL